MRLKSRLTSMVAVGAALTAMAGFSVAHAGAALADPHAVYVTVGSDTTQDAINQFALDEKGNLIASYNATNPVTQTIGEVITPNNTIGGQCSFARPDGSTQGLNALGTSEALLPSVGQAAPPADLTNNVEPQAGCVDFSRSSSAPGANANPNGVVIYIPFGLDALTTTYGSNGNLANAADEAALNALTYSDAGGTPSGDLVNLYKNCQTVTEAGVTFNPNPGAATGGQVQLDLYVPQSGSGTRNTWLTDLGISTTANLPTCVSATIIAGPDINQAVEENDGTAVSTDPNGIAPFSVAQWISQTNGHDNRLHSAVLDDINGVGPCGTTTGTACANAAGDALNTSFPIIREVYNVFPYTSVQGATADPTLQSLFVGTSSILCRDALTITSYGFARLNSTTPDLCGAVTSNLRAYATYTAMP